MYFHRVIETTLCVIYPCIGIGQRQSKTNRDRFPKYLPIAENPVFSIVRSDNVRLSDGCPIRVRRLSESPNRQSRGTGTGLGGSGEASDRFRWLRTTTDKARRIVSREAHTERQRAAIRKSRITQGKLLAASKFIGNRDSADRAESFPTRLRLPRQTRDNARGNQTDRELRSGITQRDSDQIQHNTARLDAGSVGKWWG